MALVLTGQRPKEEAVTDEMILALLAAVVRAPAAGRAVAGGVAGVVEAAAGAAVSDCGDAAQPGADHADAPVSGGGGGLGLDVQVLVGRGKVQVRILAQVSEEGERKRRDGDDLTRKNNPKYSPDD